MIKTNLFTSILQAVTILLIFIYSNQSNYRHLKNQYQWTNQKITPKPNANVQNQYKSTNQIRDNISTSVPILFSFVPGVA